MRQNYNYRLTSGGSAIRNQQSAVRRGFTLVELLVVITIIGILAALLLAAVGPVTRTANQARIRAQMTQFNTALEDYKNNVGSYPPNLQTDLNATYKHLDNARVLSDFKRHFNKAFPQNQEPPELIAGLVGLSTAGAAPTETPGDIILDGGMNAAEAVVFWLGGFSDDPKYPITGPGGPSYSIVNLNGGVDPNEADPIDNRSWRLGIDIASLAPRGEDGYFPNAYSRYVVYADPRDGSNRRLNFWFLKAPNSTVPYVYFDTSRGAGASASNDPPALTDGDYSGATDDIEALTQMQYVHAVKTLNSNRQANNPFLFANNDKFQILHASTDDDWGVLPMVNPTPPATTDPTDPNFEQWLINSKQFHDGGIETPDLLYFPNGPWGLELTDTLSNFSDGTLGDAQE